MNLSGKIRFLIGSSLVLQGTLIANQRNYLSDHWTVSGDFVYMKIHQASDDQPLVDDPNKVRKCGKCSDYSIFGVDDFNNDYRPGYSARLQYLPNYWMILEGKFLYLHDSQKSEPIRKSSLYYPFCDVSSTTDYQGAYQARASYHTTFYNAELNYWWNMTPRWVDYFGFSVIGGLRYFNETESLTDCFKHAISGSSSNETSCLKTWTENHIAAIQAGVNLQVNISHYFSWEINLKGGLMENYAKGSGYVKDVDNTVTRSHFRDSKWEFGLFTDLSAAAVFSFAKHFDFHVGYDFLLLSNLATAKDQLPKCAFKPRGGVDVNSTVTVYGVFGGLGISF